MTWLQMDFIPRMTTTCKGYSLSVKVCKKGDNTNECTIRSANRFCSPGLDGYGGFDQTNMPAGELIIRLLELR